MTDQALFVSNSTDIASVDETGTVRGKNLGETAVLIRAAGMATSAIVGVIGPEIANYPAVPSSNFIDDFVFDKLRRFRMAPSELSSDGEFLRRVCLTSRAGFLQRIAFESFSIARIRRSATSSSMH